MANPDAQRPITIIFADRLGGAGHRLFRLLAARSDLQVVGQANDLRTASRLIEINQPAWAIIDRGLAPENLAAELRVIRGHSPRTRIILLLDQYDDDAVIPALWAGAHRCWPRRARLSALSMRLPLVALRSTSRPARSAPLACSF